MQPSGGTTGPYQAWQVLALGAVVSLVALWSGLRERPLAGAASLTVALTTCFVLDNAFEEGTDGLWLVGAVLLAAGAVAGTTLVSTLAALWRREARQTARTESEPAPFPP